MSRIPLLVLSFFLAPAFAAAADAPTEIPLWPSPVPGEKGDVEDKPADPKSKHFTSVAKPTLTIYRPAKDVNTGAAVVVAPGGGYRVLAWEHEGTQVGEWLQNLGVTAVVVKYRVPRRTTAMTDAPPVWALQDAQRAISFTRSKAKEWDIDPARIGMLGFSAGGHLTAWTATNSDKRSYDPVDDADKASCRPDFAVMIYPGGVLEKGSKETIRSEIRVSKDTPPCFFAVAYNDAGPLDSTLRLFAALREAKVSAELHVYAAGAHGFGMRPADKPYAGWPKRCEEWMKSEGWLTAKK